MAGRKPLPRQWMRVQACNRADIDLLRRRLDPKGPLWSDWEYKLRNGSVIIYSPVIPWNRNRKPDPSLRYMALHLRIVPTHPGPYQLEFRRHTEQWWPLGACPPGSMESIARFIAQDKGWCRGVGQEDWDREHGR